MDAVACVPVTQRASSSPSSGILKSTQTSTSHHITSHKRALTGVCSSASKSHNPMIGSWKRGSNAACVEAKVADAPTRLFKSAIKVTEFCDDSFCNKSRSSSELSRNFVSSKAPPPRSFQSSALVFAVSDELLAGFRCVLVHVDFFFAGLLHHITQYHHSTTQCHHKEHITAHSTTTATTTVRPAAAPR